MLPGLAGLLAPRLRRLTPDLPPMLALWEVSLQEPDAPASCNAVLSDVERGRADGFRFAHLRRRHVWCRLALRHLAGSRLGCTAGDLPLRHSPAGRPFIPDAPLDFNLSHSADLAVIALLDGGGQVGIDIEAVVPLADMGRVARRVFTDQEMAEQARDGMPALEAFYRRWTCKEAYLKALGTGLGVDPRSVALGFTPGGAATVLEGPVMHGCTLVSFVPRPGFMAAFAILSEQH